MLVPGWEYGTVGFRTAGLGEEVCLDENLLLLCLDEPGELASSFGKEHCCQGYL